METEMETETETFSEPPLPGPEVSFQVPTGHPQFLIARHPDGQSSP